MAATINRDQAITEIRSELLKLVDDEHSMCQVAGERNIFCRGFKQWTDEELAQRYDWIVEKHKAAGREELEDLANRWQLARQLVQDETLSCDVQCVERDQCMGWDTHSDQALARYYKELLHRDVVVTSEGATSATASK